MAIVQQGQELGFSVSARGQVVSHLLYADDILLAAKASLPNARRMASLLQQYCGWTGQRVNQEKSVVMFSKATLAWRRQHIRRSLGFRCVTAFDYLGISLGVKRLRAGDFKGMVQKVRQRTLGWGSRRLSMAGRACLVDTVLLAIPSYVATHTIVPKSVLLEVEQICRRFLWQHDPEHRGFHFVSWSTVCRPAHAGGLGFHGPTDWIGPLRARLAWDTLQQPDSLLSRCLGERYGSCMSVRVQRLTDSPSWRVISDGAVSLARIVRWEIGDGKSVDFLEQAWVLDRPLCSWPTFVCCDLQGAKVAEFLEEGGGWDRRKLLEVVGGELCDRILAIPTSGGELDTCVLKERFSGLTIAKRAYAAILPETEERFTWLRRVSLPPKVRIFWWRILWRAVPTMEWLARRGLCAETDCGWGCATVESLEHLVSDCGKLREVVAYLRSWHLPVPSFASLADCLTFLASAGQRKSYLASLFCMGVYWIWRARCDLRFGRTARSSHTIAALLVAELPHLSLAPLSKQWCHHQPFGLPSSSHWCTPPSKWIKVNLDGALLPSHAAGLGVVFRDEFGRVLRVAGRYFEHWDAGMVELEAFAFLEGLIQDWMFALEGMIIEGDCLNVIRFLQSCVRTQRWKEIPRLASSFELLLRFHSLLFSHTARENNRVADFCAHEAIRVGSTFCFDEVPPYQTELQMLVAADLNGGPRV